ncbi:glycoside hydrolase [Auriculariales sp. MPI-PUGE-AT-0066]|nr:glycoside hydrolase [Auriculariales sp. MPI-PUGE-AT-0066]
MNLSALVLTLIGLISHAGAHYTFPGFIANGATSGEYVNVRMTNNHWSHGPVQDVSSIDMRCYNTQNLQTATTVNVTAGSTVGFTVDGSISHPGPLLVYMAKAPGSVDSFDGSGTVWFKIYQEAPTFSGGTISWPSSGKTTVNWAIPSALPSGEYLLRVEHIALHSASSTGGAQLYIACAQVRVSGGGSGNPSPLVSFPGAYKATDPGILFQLYYPVPTSYTMPGPAVWRG